MMKRIRSSRQPNPPHPQKRRRSPSPDYDDDDNETPSHISDRTISDDSSISPSIPSPSNASHQSVSSSLDTPQWQSKAPFQPSQLFISSLPIFRKSDIQHYEPVEECSEEELSRFTFKEALDYFLRLPANANKRRALFTDQQYIDLLHQCVSTQKVAEQMQGRSKTEERWLYGQLKMSTYKQVQMSYRVAEDQTDTGPVLVTFKDQTDGKGECFTRRPATSTEPLLLGAMRRCIPYSQLEAAIEISHRGPLGVGHAGQDGTWHNCLRMFDGITRDLCREYVKRCGMCQTKQAKVHKAALVPLSSKAL
jgi:hypothetical protein